MSITTSDMTPADIAAVCGNGNRNSGDGSWSDGGALWMIILLLFFEQNGMFGNRNNRNNDNGGGTTYMMPPYASGFGGGCGCSVPATQADLAAGFNNSAVLNNLNDIKLGQAGIQQTLCQGFNGVNTTVLQGLNGVERGFCDLSHQISDCCCATQRAIDGVNYNMATQACDTRNAISNATRDIVDNANANSRAILDFLTQDKIATLTAENNSLKSQAMFAQQNALNDARSNAAVAEILRRTGNDCPTAAYIVQPPTPVNFPVNACGQAYAGCNSGCGSF